MNLTENYPNRIEDNILSSSRKMSNMNESNSTSQFQNFLETNLYQNNQNQLIQCSDQDNINSDKIKQENHKKFIQIILNYEPSIQDVIELEKVKQATQMDIHLRYLRSKPNRNYRFPFKSNIKQKIQKVQVDCDLLIIENSCNEIIKSQIYSDEDEQLSDLNVPFYDLSHQNVFGKLTEDKNSSHQANYHLNKQQSKRLPTNQFSIPFYINNLESKISKDFQKRIATKKLTTLHEGKSLEKNRVLRLIEKQKYLKAIKSHSKLRKNNSLQYLKKNLKIIHKDLQILPPTIKCDEQTQLRINEKKIVQNIQKKQSPLKNRKNDVQLKKNRQNLSTTLANLFIMKSHSQRKFKNENIKQIKFLPFLKKKKLNNEQKVNDTNRKSHKKLRKLKTEQNSICDEIKQVVGHKLKTQVSTPSSFNTPYIILSHKQSKQQIGLSKLFSNEKFKNIEKYILQEKNKKVKMEKSKQTILLNINKLTNPKVQKSIKQDIKRQNIEMNLQKSRYLSEYQNSQQNYLQKQKQLNPEQMLFIDKLMPKKYFGKIHK